jgi:hypothetical protein
MADNGFDAMAGTMAAAMDGALDGTMALMQWLPMAGTIVDALAANGFDAMVANGWHNR